MSGCGRVWTKEEDRILLDRRAGREKFARIAVALDRTPRAVRERYSALTCDPGAANLPRIKRLERSSAALRSAVLTAIHNFANDNGVSEHEARMFLLGGTERQVRTPGTEIIHKTCSATRLYAATMHSAAA